MTFLEQADQFSGEQGERRGGERLRKGMVPKMGAADCDVWGKRSQKRVDL